MIERFSLTEQIVVKHQRRIISGELAERVALRQEALATELGVSRIPVREATQKLRAEGFAQSELHKGATVRSLSLNEIRELFDVRIHLETWLFELAVRLLTDTELTDSDRSIEEQLACENGGNWGDLNWRFHEVLLSASRCPIGLQYPKSVHDNANRRQLPDRRPGE